MEGSSQIVENKMFREKKYQESRMRVNYCEIGDIYSCKSSMLILWADVIKFVKVFLPCVDLLVVTNLGFIGFTGSI